MSSTAEDPIDWYILRDRQQSGPYTRAFVRDAARGGGLARHDLVWRPGWAEWRDAGTVDGIFDAPADGPPVPANARSSSPPPVIAPQPASAPPPSAGPAPARSNYLVRHWRGELSLPMAFWLNGLVIGGLAAGLLGAATHWFVNADRSFESYKVVIVLIVSFIIVLAVNAWQVVGIWRSAACHSSRGGWALWARSAQFVVVVGVLVIVFVNTHFELPRMTDNVQLAFEDHHNGGHAFHLLGDGTELEFSGAITLGTARDFARVLGASPNVKVRHLHSGGGRAADGYDIAEQVWNRKLDTYVSVECSSACAHIFMAGRKRWLGEHAKLGFHQPGSVRGSDAGLRLAAQYEREYLESRGMPADFVDKILSTPSSSIWYPTHEELLRTHVISGIAGKGKFAD